MSSTLKFQGVKEIQARRRGGELAAEVRSRESSTDATSPTMQEIELLRPFMIREFGYVDDELDQLIREAGASGAARLLLDWQVCIVAADVDNKLPEEAGNRARHAFSSRRCVS